MTEEIIKECKNCDALGIDSEIGVYYCCLSHRQDDLPKEFTCNDFTPDKQLKRLEQENKELKEMLSKEPKAMQAFQISYSGLKRDNEVLWGMVKDYKSALEEIKKDFMCFRSCIIPFHTGDKDKIPHSMADAIQDYCESIMNKIKEVIK